MNDAKTRIVGLLLEAGELTIHQLAQRAKISVRQTQRVISYLRSRHELYVARWALVGIKAYPIAVYSLGDASDAPKPPSRSATEYQRAWRERRRQSAV